MSPLSICRNYVNNFVDFFNYTNKDNKIKILAILIIASLVGAYTAFSLYQGRFREKQNLSDEDQRINDHAKQKISQKDLPVALSTQQEESLPIEKEKHVTVDDLVVTTEVPLSMQQEEPLPIKKKTHFTVDELMVTTDLTQDELFAYAKDESRRSAQDGLALMKRAAEMGHVEAMFMVGQCYRFGSHTRRKPIEKDISQAMIWLEKAANAGNDRACEYIANMYLNGDGVHQNSWEGARWLLLGFKNGAKRIGIDVGKNSRVVFSSEIHAKEYLEKYFFIKVS